MAVHFTGAVAGDFCGADTGAADGSVLLPHAGSLCELQLLKALHTINKHVASAVNQEQLGAQLLHDARFTFVTTH